MYAHHIHESTVRVITVSCAQMRESVRCRLCCKLFSSIHMHKVSRKLENTGTVPLPRAAACSRVWEKVSPVHKKVDMKD